MVELISPIVRRWCEDASRNPDAFWAAAADMVPWFRRWDKVLDWTPPTFRWYVGGRTNLAYNCLDHHVARGWGGHAALIAEDERGGRAVYTYAQLLDLVEQLSAALRGLGIGAGDRVAIYMPTCPEAIALMLAATRIGAVHMVVFAGFGAGALADRIALSGARAVFAADVTYRRGRDVPLKGIVDDAVAAVRAPGGAAARDGLGEKTELLRCPACDWSTTWGAYHKTYRDKQLVGGNAIGVFREFVRRAEGAGSARDRMILVDWIVHEAHKTTLAGELEFHRPTAVNLIEGRMRELIVFLDELAYGPACTPGLAERAYRWRAEIRPRLGRKPAPP